MFMCGVLLVVQDRDLSETLSAVLEAAGYSVAACPDITLALNRLRVAEAPLVVMLSHGGPDQEGERVLAAAPESLAHAYLLLSTDPSKAPVHWNPHTKAFVPVIAMPFDVDLLIAQVEDAVSQLQCPCELSLVPAN
jgi:DNA-binding NtrC family response regulator